MVWLTILFILAVLIGLPVLLLALRDTWVSRRNRKTPKQLEQHALEYDKRLLNPDWDAVQGMLEGSIVIPKALKALYANTALLQLESFDVLEPNGVDWSISYFLPANASAVRQDQNFPHNAFWFASSEPFGAYFVVLWREDLPTPVFLSGEHGLTAVAPSLETFLSWPRSEKVAT